MDYLYALVSTPQRQIFCTCLLSLAITAVCWRWLSGHRRVQNSVTPRSTPIALTLRVRNLPDCITLQQLPMAFAGPQTAESGNTHDMAPGDSDIVVHSLTRSTGYDRDSQVATIFFSRLPLHLQSQIFQETGLFEESVRLDSIATDIKVDTHFSRFTPLYWPEDWDVEYDLLIPATL